MKINIVKKNLLRTSVRHNQGCKVDMLMTLGGPKSVGWKTNSEINNTSKYVIKWTYKGAIYSILFNLCT